MALAAGIRFGPYEVLSPLGAGGMGEVYRARDDRLNRDVALKILAGSLATDAEHVARFRREAQVLASLNHPNIAGIYGIEESGSVRALVMELVEGPTLQDRLAAGAMPPEDALPIAMQIAEALEAAHDRGIIHRDLKPANIKVTPGGSVKVLDFGLAAMVDEPGRAAGASHSPTMSLGATQAGLIMGTAPYMSPEQAAGKLVDKRTDIWSFGVVLWEMLTGRQLLAGETVTHTLADALRAPIDDSRLPRTTPATIRELLRRCLDRDAKRRLRDIGEARIRIERWLAHPVEAAQPARSGAASALTIAPWIAAAALLATLAALAVVHFRETAAPAPALRFDVPPPDQATRMDYPAVSPDGRRLAFVATVAGRTLLWVRPLDQLTAQPVPETDDATFPFWSPDSRVIGYFASGKLKSVDPSRGITQPICDAGALPKGATWNANGTILFGMDTGPLWRVPATGGTPTRATTLDASELTHAWPSFLPDNNHFLYWIQARGPDRSKDTISMGTLDAPDSSEHRPLLTGSMPLFSAGHILFERDGVLMARPFDDTRLEWRGDPFPVAEDVRPIYLTRFGWRPFSVSTAGTLVYRAGTGQQSQLAWFDRRGTPVGQLGPAGEQLAPAIAPNGQHVAAALRDAHGKTDVWLTDVARNTSTRFTAGPAFNSVPVWSPDGNRIVFNSNRDNTWNLYIKPSNGVGTEELLLKTDVPKLPTDWAPNGFIIYEQRLPKSEYDVWALPLDGERKPWPVVASEFNDVNGQVSPNGRWLAYDSYEGVRAEVYVQGFPRSNGKVRISTAGGSRPRWNRNGRELFYLSADRKMMAVEVQTDGDTFVVSRTTELFQTQAADTPFVVTLYDVTSDGTRFLINSVIAANVLRPMTVVVNFAQKR